MTKEEAKIILEARRPDGRDDADPLMAEALQLCRSDPDLREWHEQCRRTDGAIAARLAEVTLPSDLQQRILGDRRNSSGILRLSFRRTLPLAAGLALLLSLALAFYFNARPSDELASFRQDMIGHLRQLPALDLAASNWPDIERWLNSKGKADTFNLPQGARRYPGLGCSEFEWKGRRVLLVCFVTQGEIIHLLILPGNREVREPNARRFIAQKNWNSVGWTDRSTDFLMMTRGPMTLLRSILDRK